MNPTVVLPIRKGLCRPGLATRVVPVDDESDKEQQTRHRACERQEAIESLRSHEVPPSLLGVRLAPSATRSRRSGERRELAATQPTTVSPPPTMQRRGSQYASARGARSTGTLSRN